MGKHVSTVGEAVTTAPTTAATTAVAGAVAATCGGAELAREIAAEQTHVDAVYAELSKASERARLVAVEGLARGRTERTGEARDEELTGLFERDALVFHAARRQHALDTQFEGLVFGRLDLDHPPTSPAPGREVRYIGRLGIRDDDYEPLVIDWRAPAAAPFYRATPVEPLGVLRRRVLRCRGQAVVGIEDDLMVPEAPDDLVVVGDGALMAALTRSRGSRMRDIVATIQRHQDEAIRAPARGVTEITGGPGTGKTVVALHRAAYLLYSDRRRYESGGILVVGPSGAYTAYIERVLPSLGEDSVSLRAMGDLVDAVTTERLDDPRTAAIKGSLRIREVLARAARDLVPGAPEVLRVFVSGYAVRLDRDALERVRAHILRSHQRNLATEAVARALAETAYRQVRDVERDDFLGRFEDHADVEAFIAAWWPQVDPRDVLLWLADRDRLGRYAVGVLTDEEQALVAASYKEALRTGEWSVADVALIDDLAARVGPVQEAPPEERGFYEIEELDTLEQAQRPPSMRPEAVTPTYTTTPSDARDRLLIGRIGPIDDYAHVLIDEAQDLSPMQWRMLARRGRGASWTVVGDAAQSSWPDVAESAGARRDAFGNQPHRVFHMTTNYRNAREIFDYAAAFIRRYVPGADIPDAVRETGVEPRELRVDGLGEGGAAQMLAAVRGAAAELLALVDGTVAIVTPARYADVLAGMEADPALGEAGVRLTVIDPLAAKGLEWDATVVVDPAEILATYAGGARTVYVALTRAAHRMTVVG